MIRISLMAPLTSCALPSAILCVGNDAHFQLPGTSPHDEISLRSLVSLIHKYTSFSQYRTFHQTPGGCSQLLPDRWWRSHSQSAWLRDVLWTDASSPTQLHYCILHWHNPYSAHLTSTHLNRSQDWHPNYTYVRPIRLWLLANEFNCSLTYIMDLHHLSTPHTV